MTREPLSLNSLPLPGFTFKLSVSAFNFYDRATVSGMRKMALKACLIASLLAGAAAALEDIPPLGLGTWLSDRDKVPHAVEFGLQNGYEHIDAAWIYRESPLVPSSLALCLGQDAEKLTPPTAQATRTRPAKASQRRGCPVRTSGSPQNCGISITATERPRG